MFEEIVGESAAIQAVLARVAKVAPTDSTVLLTGETGQVRSWLPGPYTSGRSVSARAIRSVSIAPLSSIFDRIGSSSVMKRERLPVRPSDASAIRVSEGARSSSMKLGELPAETQIALLRVLQEREF